MGGYVLAWCLVVLAGIAGLFGAWQLLQTLAVSLRAAVLAALFVFFVVPAPVPRFEGEYAPAFVVAIFEFLFQTDGEPQTAAGILLLSVAAAALVAWAVAYFAGARGRPRSQV